MLTLRYQYKHAWRYWTHHFLNTPHGKKDLKDHFNRLKDQLCYAEVNGRVILAEED